MPERRHSEVSINLVHAGVPTEKEVVFVVYIAAVSFTSTDGITGCFTAGILCLTLCMESRIRDHKVLALDQKP